MAGELRGMLTGAVTDITTNVNDASAAIGQLSQTLAELDRVMREQIDRLGTDALDALEPLRLAMEGAAAIFTGATVAAGSALDAPDVGFEDRVKSSAAALGGFEDALVRLAGRMDGVLTGAPSKSSVTAAPVSSDQILSTVRRYGRALNPRVA